MSKGRVAIVGGGLAGLAAAMKLAELGVEALPVLPDRLRVIDRLEDLHQLAARHRQLHPSAHPVALGRVEMLEAELAGRRPDFFFIDGDHSAAGCRSDWQLAQRVGARGAGATRRLPACQHNLEAALAAILGSFRLGNLIRFIPFPVMGGFLAGIGWELSDGYPHELRAADYDDWVTPTASENGRITPEKLIAAVKAGGGTDNELCLELAFREREPTDRSVVAALKDSVAYWAPHAKTGYN